MSQADSSSGTRLSGHGLLGDDRGVSEVLGAVLLFGLLIAVLIAFQATGVPVLNQGVEYEHNQRAQSQLDLLRTNLILVATTGDGSSTQVELGTDYPNRMFLLNPPSASGRLHTDSPAPVEIRNAGATGEVGDYWTGKPQTFTTRPITYSPDYNEYDNAPQTHLEHGLLYNQFSGTQITLSDENLIDGRQISLLLINGSLSASGTTSQSIDLEPTSAPVRTVTVRNETAPVVVSIPTRLSESKWRELLADELTAQGGHVSSISYTTGTPYNRLVLELEPGVTYELSMAMIGVGTDIDRPGAHYITTTDKDEQHLPPGESTRVTVEVRDRYDNPVSGVSVDASLISGEGTIVPVEPVTGTDGKAVFRYTAPADATTASIQARIAASPSPQEAATFTVDVFDPGQTQDFIDMGQRSKVVFIGVTSPTGSNNHQAEIDFQNRDTTNKEIVAARFVSYYDSAPSSPTPDGLVLGGSNTKLEEGGAMTTLSSPIGIAPGATERIVFDFRDATGDPAGSISNPDFVVVVFKFADGSESMYLIQLSTK